MQRNKLNIEGVADQMEEREDQEVDEMQYECPEGNTDIMISTGSTLLDLAISGGRIRGGGIPGGILVEIFGPSSMGKTVMLCEIAGDVQRKGGIAQFNDPEGRLNKKFADIFDYEIDPENYSQPNTPTDLLKPIRTWNPEPKDKVHGIFADSLAALASDLEMEDKKDEYQRRAKMFSQEFRKTCRILTQKNFILICSNQIRDNIDAGPFQEQYSSPGGQAIGFYSSLRLRIAKASPSKITKKIKFKGKEIEKEIGVRSQVYVYKSSVWMPHGSAPVSIIWDYGIDDIRENLQFLKSTNGNTTYTLNGVSLDQSLEKAIKIVEDDNLELKLKNEVIDLWEEIQKEFATNRVKKRRV